MKKKLNHKLYKQTNIINYYYEFSRIRALCKREAKLNYTFYMKKLQSNFTHNPKSF